MLYRAPHAGPSTAQSSGLVLRCRCGQRLVAKAGTSRQITTAIRLRYAEPLLARSNGVPGAVPPPAAVEGLTTMMKSGLGKETATKAPRREFKAQKAAISLVSDYWIGLEASAD